MFLFVMFFSYLFYVEKYIFKIGTKKRKKPIHNVSVCLFCFFVIVIIIFQIYICKFDVFCMLNFTILHRINYHVVNGLKQILFFFLLYLMTVHQKSLKYCFYSMEKKFKSEKLNRIKCSSITKWLSKYNIQVLKGNTKLLRV